MNTPSTIDASIPMQLIEQLANHLLSDWAVLVPEPHRHVREDGVEFTLGSAVAFVTTSGRTATMTVSWHELEAPFFEDYWCWKVIFQEPNGLGSWVQLASGLGPIKGLRAVDEVARSPDSTSSTAKYTAALVIQAGQSIVSVSPDQSISGLVEVSFSEAAANEYLAEAESIRLVSLPQ